MDEERGNSISSWFSLESPTTYPPHLLNGAEVDGGQQERAVNTREYIP